VHGSFALAQRLKTLRSRPQCIRFKSPVGGGGTLLLLLLPSTLVLLLLSGGPKTACSQVPLIAYNALSLQFSVGQPWPQNSQPSPTMQHGSPSTQADGWQPPGALAHCGRS